jgi:hypothetical protein
MKINKIILLGLLLSANILYAQKDFRPGYIINASGDTIVGEIDYRGDIVMSNICRFKSANNEVREYSPMDIEAFRFINSKYYVSKEVESNKVFLEYLIKGKVNIYYMRDEKGDHYFIDKDDMQLKEIPFEQGMRDVDNKKLFYQSTIHIGLLNLYMHDTPELHSQIQSVKKPEHYNLIKLAEAYHNTVCEDEECIIYGRSLPFIKILPEITGGAGKYSNVEGLSDNFSSQFGVIGHIWMPRSSEKLYFKTGLLFTQLEINGAKQNLYKIPCHFEYIYPRGYFRPRLAYGLNFYLPTYRSVSFDVGGNIKLSKHLYLSVTSDIEFHSRILILPKDLLSYSLKLGLFMDFN